MSPQLGATIDRRYLLEEEIGAGGMGTVYRAQHVIVRDYVALKLLRSGLAEDEAVRERFLREPQLAAQIRHPNIIPIRDAGDENGLPYLAMEYVEGSDLGRVLEQEGRLDPERALTIVEQVASALDAAHARGLVHRDVKPANILVGRDGHVFLTDFGIAKDAALDGLTQRDVFIGTIQYAAPEQIRRKKVDARTDVYALGCVLYHCLVGAPPFEADTDYDLMDAHVKDPPPRPSEAGLPAGLDTVIATAMAKDPAERYASSGDLVAATRNALAPTAAKTELDLPAAPAPTELDIQPVPAPTEIDLPAVVPTEVDRAELPPPELPPSPAKPAGPRRPFPRRAALITAAVLLLAGGLGAGLAVALSGGGSSKHRAAPPAPYPNAVERGLLRHVPVAIRGSCRRKSHTYKTPFTFGATGGIGCDGTGAVAPTVSYYQFPSTARMNAMYQDSRSHNDVQQNSGACDAGRPGEGPWTSNHEPAGRYFCYREPDIGAEMDWTDDRYDIYSWVYTDSSLAKLWTAWLDLGPV